LKPARRRTGVLRLQVAYQVTERRACRVLNYPRASHRYQSVRDDRAELRIELRDLASNRPRYGYRRLHVLLRRKGYLVNAKLVYRLYCEEGLGIRGKRPGAARVARSVKRDP